MRLIGEPRKAHGIKQTSGSHAFLESWHQQSLLHVPKVPMVLVVMFEIGAVHGGILVAPLRHGSNLGVSELTMKRRAALYNQIDVGTAVLKQNPYL